ncbi:MAG TPA: ABC transporter permease, partial [Longimicrobiales bacterium]|nr:ABC transporter permease [Longimicrobiales bacterium]
MKRAAVALYHAAAAILLPRAFREEFGAELEDIVAERLAASRGVVCTGVVLLAELADLVRAAAREWRTALARPRRAQSRYITGRGEQGMGGGSSDLRTTVRSLLRRPGLALAVALTMGLGIGATMTIYSVVDGVVLRPLPYHDPSTLVAVGAIAPGASADPETGIQDLTTITSLDLDGLRERAQSFETLAGMTPYRLQESDENGVQVFVPAARVTGEVFPMLGVGPVLGRAFTADELVYQGPLMPATVVIISHGYWQRRYAGDPGVLGRPLESVNTPDGARPTIVGVLPEGFEPPEAFFPRGELPEVYAPRGLPGTAEMSVRLFQVLGRLAPGVTVEQARAEAAALSQELAASARARRMPGGEQDRVIGVNGLHADTIGTTGRALWAFLAAAGLLLLLTGLNAATLLLARALDRTQELGVRVALGAGRGRVLRLLLVEAGVLSLMGGTIGVLLAYLGVGSFLRFAPPTIPRLSTVAVDERVLVVALVATIVTGVAAGLVPALGFLRRDAWEGLQTGARTVSDPASRVRTVLVGAQLALAMMLFCGAGLLFSSFMRIRSADPGFEPGGLIVMSETPPGLIRITRANIGVFYQRWDPVLAAQAAVPGVRSVAGASGVPFQAPTWAPRILLPGDEPDVVREGIAGYAITPGYLETMGIDVVNGRGFGTEDGPDAERVVLVNEEFVRTQLYGVAALGVIITRDVEGPGSALAIPMRIVGVVEDVVQARAEDGPRPAVYLPYTQVTPQQLLAWWPIIRTDRAAEEVIPELRASLTGTQFTPENVSTMADRVGVTQITPRFQSMLIGTFSLVALLLAA